MESKNNPFIFLPGKCDPPHRVVGPVSDRQGRINSFTKNKMSVIRPYVITTERLLSQNTHQLVGVFLYLIESIFTLKNGWRCPRIFRYRLFGWYFITSTFFFFPSSTSFAVTFAPSM